MSDDEDETNLNLEAVFLEPPRPPSPDPTTATYSRVLPPWTSNCHHDAWSEIEVSLVGSHPLWGHYLWNASRSFASYLDHHLDLYKDRSVLELGAGGGLPGLVTAKNGAKCVVLSDYPDQPLLDNLKRNVERNLTGERAQHVQTIGYIWGKPVQPLLEIQSQLSDTEGFDLIIMSDLIFNHSQHDALLRSAEMALRKGVDSEPHKPCVLVFFSHHRPHLAHRDMEFFLKAAEQGWICNEIVTERFPPMFPDDPGDEEVRATVHGWRLTRTSESL